MTAMLRVVFPLPRHGGEGQGEGAVRQARTVPRPHMRSPLTPTLSPRYAEGEGEGESLDAGG